MAISTYTPAPLLLFACKSLVARIIGYLLSSPGVFLAYFISSQMTLHRVLKRVIVCNELQCLHQSFIFLQKLWCISSSFYPLSDDSAVGSELCDSW